MNEKQKRSLAIKLCCIGGATLLAGGFIQYGHRRDAEQQRVCSEKRAAGVIDPPECRQSYSRGYGPFFRFFGFFGGASSGNASKAPPHYGGFGQAGGAHGGGGG